MEDGIRWRLVRLAGEGMGVEAGEGMGVEARA